MVSLKVLAAVSLASVSVLASPAPAASTPGLLPPASLPTAAPVPESLSPSRVLPDTPEPVFWSDDRIHVLGTRNKVDEKDMQDAIRCLSTWCTRNAVEKNGKARCVIGSAVVYLCNYGNDNPCSGAELLDGRAEVQEKTGSMTGWIYLPGWKKTYGFDRWCPDGLCDNGFKESRHDQCGNVKKAQWSYDGGRVQAPREISPEDDPEVPPVE